MRTFLVLLLLTPALAPLAAAEPGFDGDMKWLFPVHNLVAGQTNVLVWGDADWTGSHDGPMDVLLTLDGAPIARYQHMYFNELNSVAVHADIPAGIEGNVTFAFILDPDNKVAETNESNNVATGTTYVHAAPFFDIQPLGLAMPEHVFAGIPFHAEAEALVTGEPQVGGNFSGDGTGYFGRFVIDGVADCCIWHMNLWPGVTQQGWPELTLGAGWHTYEIHLDVRDTAYELDEANNVARGWFYVHASPADAVVSLEIEQPVLETDLGALAPHPTDRTAHLQVCNEGDMWIPSGAVTLEIATPGMGILLGGTETLLSETFDWLAPGACLAWDVEYPLAAVGEYELTARVEASAETELANNVAAAEDFFVLGGAGGVALL